MSEKINMTALLQHHGDNSFEEWLAAALLESFSQRFKVEEICDMSNSTHVFDVELKINGKEVSFSDVIKCMYMNFEHNTKKCAKDIIYDAIGDKIQSVTDIMDKLEEQLEREAEKVLGKEQ